MPPMSTSSADSSRYQEPQYIRSLLLQATDSDELQEAPAQQVALVPQKMLPEDVLRLIFQWCIPQDEVCVSSSEVKPWLLLTRICSSWRTLAINTPELWRVVAMELRNNDDYEHRIQVTHQWLKRAGNMTRSLRIGTSGVDEKWCTEAVNRLVLPFRFKSLNLLLSRHQFDRILSLQPQFTQSLENIQFLATGDPPLDLYTKESHPRNKFLNLKTLLITGTYWASHLVAIFPWGQLHCVSIWGTTIFPASFINIFADSVVLEELRVTIGPDSATSKAQASFITLPNLRHLDLGFRTGSNAEILLYSLILPKVEVLSMGGPELNCTSLSFADLAQRSSMNQIQSLCLDEGKESYQLDHLLKYTPSLSHLKVLGRLEFDGGTLEDMSTGRLGPNLEIIQLFDVADIFGILDMVRRRVLNARQGALVKPIIDIILPEPDINSFDLYEELNGLGIKLAWLA